MGNHIRKNKEFEKFCSNHNERQIYPVEKILKKYPSLRIYGFKQAMKEWTHYNFCHFDIYECDCNTCDDTEESCIFNSKTCHAKTHYFSKSPFYPRFLPDLYLVTSDVILLFEIEDYNPMTRDKMNKVFDWVSVCDMEFEPEIIIYGFDRFGNFQRIIYNSINGESECIEWLKELENTPDYDNKKLKHFNLYEDRNGNFPVSAYCKASLSEEELFKFHGKLKRLEKTTKGSRYY